MFFPRKAHYQCTKGCTTGARPLWCTVWLNRNQLAELFGRDIKTIGKRIGNALKEELEPSTVAKFATVQNEGGRTVTREIEYYNLDMIISVGYRVKSKRGVELR
ncbi:MAG: virulence RhuM family protein [Blautia sp.]|nr:virulence RhuM family protein [Blautia sp.]